MDGNFIREFKSLQDAANFLKISYTTSITACLKKKIPSALGFRWCYLHEKDNFDLVKLKRVSTSKIKIKITCIFTGKVTIFESINKTSKSLKVSTNVIYKGLKEKEYKNLIWEKI